MKFLLFHQRKRVSSSKVFFPGLALGLEHDQSSEGIGIESLSVLDKKVMSISLGRSDQPHDGIGESEPDRSLCLDGRRFSPQLRQLRPIGTLREQSNDFRLGLGL
jgi:hypothetical protein